MRVCVCVHTRACVCVCVYGGGCNRKIKIRREENFIYKQQALHKFQMIHI